jgi:hypothetical protein
MEKQPAPVESEFYFQEIVRALPAMHHPAKLEELSLLALTLLLRRAASRDLRDELSQQIKTIVAKASADPSPDAMRQAAKSCIGVLREAKKRRLPRNAQSVPLSHPHPPPASDGGARKANWILWTILAVVVLAILIGALIEWKSRRTDTLDPNDIVKFVEQITETAQGKALANPAYGTVELSSMNGMPVVIARGVPPRLCAASGMRLVRKGVLGINGETPQRISSAIITELCYKNEGAATLMWSPTK